VNALTSMNSLPINRNQRGAVLVVSLILLLIMTVLALAASQNTRMQEKMSGNTRDSDLAFQASEAALRYSEEQVILKVPAPTLCAAPPCVFYDVNVLPANPADLAVQGTVWWEQWGRQYRETAAGTTPPAALPKVARDPRAVIEKVYETRNLDPASTLPVRIFYRVTAHGTGGTETAEAVVQSTYAAVSF
jgi:type IV pilus assembly protein PilX